MGAVVKKLKISEGTLTVQVLDGNFKDWMVRHYA